MKELSRRQLLSSLLAIPFAGKVVEAHLSEHNYDGCEAVRVSPRLTMKPRASGAWHDIWDFQSDGSVSADRLQRLEASIREHGLMENGFIGYFDKNGQHRIRCGVHRLLALKNIYGVYDSDHRLLEKKPYSIWVKTFFKHQADIIRDHTSDPYLPLAHYTGKNSNFAELYGHGGKFTKEEINELLNQTFYGK